MISPVLSACLLGNVVMAMAVPSHPWRPAMCLSARACFYVCVSPLVPLISLPLSSRLPAPFARVGERGACASMVLLPAVFCLVLTVALLASWVMGNECVDFVDVLPIG